jgi:hypothetical protein
LALQRQIEELKRSEEIQRQRAAVLQQPQPVSREQKLAMWRQSGLSEEEAHFLQRNPSMIDFPQITSFAIHRATEAGLERGTDAHFAAVEKIFNANFGHLQAQAANPDMRPPTPTFFTPPPPRSAPNPSHLVSAPVSRSIPNASGRRHTPGKVTMTPQEVEAARISGISIEQYAKEKIKYEGMREDGSYRDNRDQRS